MATMASYLSTSTSPEKARHLPRPRCHDSWSQGKRSRERTEGKAIDLHLAATRAPFQLVSRGSSFNGPLLFLVSSVAPFFAEEDLGTDNETGHREDGGATGAKKNFDQPA